MSGLIFDKLSSIYDDGDKGGGGLIEKKESRFGRKEKNSPSSASTTQRGRQIHDKPDASKSENDKSKKGSRTSQQSNSNKKVPDLEEEEEEEDDYDPAALSPEEMQRLMGEVQTITKSIEGDLFEFFDVVKGIEELHRLQKDTACLEERKHIGEDLAEGLSEGNAAMITIQDKLKDLRRVGYVQHMRAGTAGRKVMIPVVGAKEEEEEGPVDDTTDTSLLSIVDRIRDNQHLHLLNRFLEICTAYHDVQETAEISDQQEIKRWLKIRFTPGSGDKSKQWHNDQCLITDEEAEQLSYNIINCDDPDKAQQLIFAQQRVVEDKINAEVQEERRKVMLYESLDVLTNQVEIRNDIRRIEKSMTQLNQLFSDMAILVDQQQPVLDSILYNCQRAERHLDNGLRQLDQAKKYQKAASSKLRAAACCIIA